MLCMHTHIHTQTYLVVLLKINMFVKHSRVVSINKVEMNKLEKVQIDWAQLSRDHFILKIKFTSV